MSEPAASSHTWHEGGTVRSRFRGYRDSRGLAALRRGRGPSSRPRRRDALSGATDQRLDVVEALESAAADGGRSLLEVAIGGLASIEGVASVIAGVPTPEQVRANAAAGSWHAGVDELATLTAAVA